MHFEGHLTLPNDIAEVPRLQAFIDKACQAAGFDMAIAMQVNLAAEEAVVNVMNYAYPYGAKGTVELNATASSGSLTLTIADAGAPFDPTTADKADITLAAEERPIGGLGIHLVRQIMDSISYQRTDDGHNVLTMKKNG